MSTEQRQGWRLAALLTLTLGVAAGLTTAWTTAARADDPPSPPPVKTITPSETISADDAVPFPVDI